MVGRRNTLLVTKRSLRNADSVAGKRPRRVIQSKVMDDTVGLSRKEEQELNKALYASLQENRRTKSLPGSFGPSTSSSISSNNNNSSSNGGSHTGHSTASTSSGSKSSKSHRPGFGRFSLGSSTRSSSSSSKSFKASHLRRHSLRTSKSSLRSHSTPPTSAGLKHGKSPSTTPRSTPVSTPVANLNVDESSQDSVRSSSESVNGSKRKIHAQRKFAQGCSLPGMVSCTPVKSNIPAVKMLSSKIPKTEDFLTFLCLRGSSILPPHLDFFNFAREEMPSREPSSRPSSAGKVKHRRESTPDSSSTSSGANEEVAEAARVSTPTSTGRNISKLVAKRSAARASAGTPETARGIVSLTQGLQRKVSTSSSSSSSARFPTSSSPSSLSVSGLTNTPPSRYRNKFYFTPEKSPSPSKASGIRPGEFTPPSLFSSSSHMASTHKFSPLVYRPSKFVPLLSAAESSASHSSSSSSSSSLSSSASASGSSRRKRRSTAPSDDSGSKRSSLGAFTPVSTSKQSSSRASTRSGSPAKVKSSRLDKTPSRDVAGVRSARKSLFGKPTSVAQQQARRIVGKSAGRAITNWKDRAKLRVSKSHDEQRDALEPRGKKRKVDKSEGRDSKSSIKKSRRLQIVKKTRMRTRLQDQTRSARVTRRQSSSDNADEVDGGKVITDKKEETEMEHKTGHSKQQKAEPVKTSQENKPRKPYKIRPLERVRTRGYSLLLASKHALKRAKRETGMARQRAQDESSSITQREGNKASGVSSGNNSLDSNTQSRTRKASERRASSEQYAVHTGPTRVYEDLSKSWGIAPEKMKLETSSTDSAIKTRQMRGDIKTKVSPSPARDSRLKKAKVQKSSPSSGSRSQSSTSSSGESSIPIFRPTEAEFSDPVSYIAKIQPLAEPYGMCRVIPPASWKLDSNKISEDIRFTSQVQQVHRLYHRWGPNVRHSAAINQHLLSELSNVTTNPQIGGVEIDLPQLYQLVEEAGGPRKMSDRKHWARIADIMNIPKQAMDRTMRLYDIYCRHVFPYATLSREERNQVEEEITAIHELQTVEDDAITRGRSMPVSWFTRIARNVQAMWFKEDPTPSQVETEYWRIVEGRSKHVAVQCGHINTRAQASGFPTRRDSSYSKHAWNLNNIPENSQCVLKYLGAVSGITIPTLHMSMLFSTSCWSTDPHSLPYIQYLHTGADLIWYCIPKSQRSKFCTAMSELVPTLVTNKPRWLKEDCVMVNPNLLREKGVKVGRCVHKPWQFVVVFPGAYTATLSCGYSVAESVHYATTPWLTMGMEASVAMSKSGEKELFSMAALLCGLAQDETVDASTLTEALPLFSSIVYKELDLRTQLHAAGLTDEKKDVFCAPATPGPSWNKKRPGVAEVEKVCQVCDRICYLSMVLNQQDDQVLCLEHGLKHVHKIKKNIKSTRLYLRYSQPELETMLKEAKDRLTFLTSRPDHMTSSQGSKTRNGSK